jgi:hypothetical protein
MGRADRQPGPCQGHAMLTHTQSRNDSVLELRRPTPQGALDIEHARGSGFCAAERHADALSATHAQHQPSRQPGAFSFAFIQSNNGSKAKTLVVHAARVAATGSSLGTLKAACAELPSAPPPPAL